MDRKDLTEKKLVLINDITDTEVDRSKDEDQRLNDTVKERDNEDQDGLRVDDTVVDHGWGIELGEICVPSASEPRN